MSTLLAVVFVVFVVFLLCIVALVALGVDEWLDEVGGCLYLEVGEALGVGEESVVVLACADVACTKDGTPDVTII